MVALLAIPIGYALGSIPSTWLLGRSRGVDIRHTGTGSVGSANLSDSVGKGFAAVGFFLDAAKGIVAAVAGMAVGDQAGAVGGGLAAIAGHGWPVWIGFAGGRSQTVTLTAGGVIAPWSTLSLLPILGAGFFARRLALSWPLALTVWPVSAAIFDGAAAAWYAAGAAALGLLLRLVGNRAHSAVPLRTAWKSRLLYDREP